MIETARLESPLFLVCAFIVSFKNIGFGNGFTYRLLLIFRVEFIVATCKHGYSEIMKWKHEKGGYYPDLSLVPFIGLLFLNL